MKNFIMTGQRAGRPLHSTVGSNSRPQKKLSISHEDDQMYSSLH